MNYTYVRTLSCHACVWRAWTGKYILRMQRTFSPCMPDWPWPFTGMHRRYMHAKYASQAGPATSWSVIWLVYISHIFIRFCTAIRPEENIIGVGCVISKPIYQEIVVYSFAYVTLVSVPSSTFSFGSGQWFIPNYTRRASCESAQLLCAYQAWDLDVVVRDTHFSPSWYPDVLPVCACALAGRLRPELVYHVVHLLASRSVEIIIFQSSFLYIWLTLILYESNKKIVIIDWEITIS